MASPPAVSESLLRHPLERPVFIASVAINLAIGAAAIVIVVLGPAWVAAHPVIERHMDRIRVFAVIAVLALPAAHLLRRTRQTRVAGNAVRLSRSQMPEIYGLLEGHCERLGLAEVPELYVSKVAEGSEAYSARGRDYIVLGGPLLEIPPEGRREAVAFALGCALGGIRLGHTRLWDEILLAYIVRIPGLRMPLMQVRTYSRDRYGAFLAPDGLRGLVLYASGGDVLPEVDLAAYLGDVRGFGGFWSRLAALGRDVPHVASRVNALYDAGLLRADPRRAAHGPRAA